MRRQPIQRRAAWLRFGASAAALGASLGAASSVASTIAVAPDAATIAVPLSVPASDTRTLLVELDGYDVTDVALRNEDALLLPTRTLDLTPGSHALRILAADASGNIDTLAEHVLEVEAGGRQSSARWNALLGTAYRIDEDPAASFAGVQEDNQRGFLELDAQTQTSRWGLRAAGAALYDTARETSPDGAEWQSPGYELQAARRFDAGAASVTLGDDDIEFGNLLFNSFTRRGLRADASAFGELLQAQVFSLYSEPRTRLDEDVLPSNEEERAIGGYTMLSPLSRHPEWLRFTAGYVDGEGTLNGATVSTLDPATLYGGEAWNAAIDSWTLGTSLWLHLEYAESRFDSDGIGQGAAASADDAQQIVLQLGSGGTLAVPGLDEWVLGWQHQEIGPRFFSMGNLLLPGDLRLDQGYLRLGWQGLRLGADVVSQHSDVDDDPLRPRHDSMREFVTASYTPLQIDPESAPWRLLGTPTLVAEFGRVTFVQPDSDALIAGYDLDSEQRTSAFGVDFGGSYLSFGVRYAEIRFDDRSQALIVDDLPVYEPQADTRERTLSVQLAWNPSSRFMLAPQYQRSELDTDGVSTAGRNDLWGLQCQTELVAERLWLQASYSETRDRLTNEDVLIPEEELASGSGAANLIYRMRGANGGWPAIDWQLGGQYLDSDFDDSWQVYLGFELNWYGGAN